MTDRFAVICAHHHPLTLSWMPALLLIWISSFFQPIDFSREDAEMLFGYDVDYRSAFEELDTDEDGEVRC